MILNDNLDRSNADADCDDSVGAAGDDNCSDFEDNFNNNDDDDDSDGYYDVTAADNLMILMMMTTITMMMMLIPMMIMNDNNNMVYQIYSIIINILVVMIHIVFH